MNKGVWSEVCIKPSMSQLFQPLKIRSITLKNRIVVSPMCQYSSEDGLANDWHLVHLGSRAIGGAGLVMTEAATVTPEGRISPDDLGIWQDAHVGPLERIVRMMHTQGIPCGIQLAHSGRKGSTRRPWSGQGAIPAEAGGWEVVGPTAEPFANNYPVPRALTPGEIAETVRAFADAARRARAAGF